MTVDLTTVREGDTVHFRDSGSAVVTGIHRDKNCSYPCNLTFKEAGSPISFRNNGEYHAYTTHLLDIISVTPRALTPEERLAKIAETVDARFPSWKEYPPGGWLPDIMRLARGEP